MIGPFVFIGQRKLLSTPQFKGAGYFIFLQGLNIGKQYTDSHFKYFEFFVSLLFKKYQSVNFGLTSVHLLMTERASKIDMKDQDWVWVLGRRK